jgi:predicted transcriptional regulator
MLLGSQCRTLIAHLRPTIAAKTRDLLAQRIIAIAQRGERDKQRLVQEALAQFVNSTHGNE